MGNSLDDYHKLLLRSILKKIEEDLKNESKISDDILYAINNQGIIRFQN
jgi:hypothetical protein